MHALEFETDISGDTLRIPTHLLSQLPDHKHVKIILLIPEECQQSNEIDLKTEILKIGESCASLPLLNSGTPNEILGYNNSGLPT